jgi:hypothetical protein
MLESKGNDMRARFLILTVCLLALSAFQAQASVFSGSGGSSLQSLFNDMGYDYIDVASYQTDLNFKLQGMMEFQLLGKSGPLADELSFGVLERRRRWWGTRYEHHTVFGRNADAGASVAFTSNNIGSDFGFFISKPRPRRWWRTTRYYSYSPFNRYNAVQALFYADPMNSNSYLIAWEGVHVGSPRSDQSYDDLVVRMTVHPAPEPATWVLLATGLVGLGIFASAKRKRDET